MNETSLLRVAATRCLIVQYIKYVKTRKSSWNVSLSWIS